MRRALLAEIYQDRHFKFIAGILAKVKLSRGKNIAEKFFQFIEARVQSISDDF